MNDYELADYLDRQDLKDALDKYERMFGTAPSNIDEIQRATTKLQVTHHVERLLEIQMLAHKAWVENDRRPLPDEIADAASNWATTKQSGVEL